MLLYSSIDHFRDTFNNPMTITVRNRIILSGTAIIILFTAIFIISVSILFRTVPTPTLDFDNQSSIAPLGLAILCELIFCASVVVVLYFSFRKTASAEVFLFILFIVSMSFDTLKTIHILLEVTVIPPYYGTIVTRAICFGRFFGVLCIFGCGLFTTGMPYERLEIVLISGLLLAFALSATLPIDMTILERNFVMSTAYDREIAIVTTVLYAFALVHFVLAAVESGNKNYLLICAGMAMVIAGREILFYRSDGIALIVAFVFLIVGSTLFSERMHEVRLWA